MAHCRLVYFCLLLLIVMLLTLQPVKLTVDLPGDVIDYDSDRLLSKIVLWLKLDSDKLLAF